MNPIKIDFKTNFITKTILNLVLVLVFVMPIHNLIIQVTTKVFHLSEYIVVYKDVFQIIIIGLMLWQIVEKTVEKTVRQTTKENPAIRLKLFLKSFPKPSFTILLIIALIALNLLAIFSSFIFNQVPFRQFIFGYYFEIWWVNFLLITAFWYRIIILPKLSLGGFTDQFFKRFPKKFLITVTASFIFVILISGLSLWLGQEKVLGVFGYSGLVTETNKSLISNSPVCHPIDYQIATCRASGTFTHPIHFASYLCLMFGLFLGLGLDSWHNNKIKNHKVIGLFYISLSVVSLVFLYLTYSRYAIIGLVTTLAILVITYLNTNQIKKAQNIIQNKLTQKLLKYISVVLVIVPFVFAFVITTFNPENYIKFLPPALAKPSSSIWHYRHTMVTWQILTDRPLGLVDGFGLGSMGSAARSKYQDLNQNFVATHYEYVAYQWFFVKETFLLTENWVLQTLINGGLFYALLYLIVVLLPIYPLFRLKWKIQNIFVLCLASGFWLVVIGNLLEHLWESQTLVIYWTLLYLFQTWYTQSLVKKIS